MEPADDLRQARLALAAVRARAVTASDEELLADLVEIEGLGRIVDGLRAGVAAEVERRSRRSLGEQRLSFRHDAKDAPDLVAKAARIPISEARRRVGIGTALAPRIALTGEVLPGKYPTLADAVAAGTVGVAAARMIVEAVQHLRKRVTVEEAAAMVDGLTTSAGSVPLPELQVLIGRWCGYLDPDGPEPDDHQRRRNRSLKIGATRADGMTRVTLDLPPEHLAVIKELLASRRRTTALRRTEPGAAPHHRAAPHRTRRQPGRHREWDRPGVDRRHRRPRRRPHPGTAGPRHPHGSDRSRCDRRDVRRHPHRDHP